jgi:hypothetical protein
MFLVLIVCLVALYEESIFGFFSRLTRPCRGDCILWIKQTNGINAKTTKIVEDTHYTNANEWKEYMNTWKEGEIPWEIEDDDDTNQNKTTVKKPEPSPILPRPLYTFQRLIVDM